MALLTVTELKASWLNIGDSSQDTRLAALINQAGAIIDGICKQPIVQQSGPYDFTGSQYKVQLLPYTVTTTLSSLQYKEEVTDAAFTTATGAILVRADGVYQVYYDDGLTHPVWRANVVVGYTDATCPYDIKSVCGEMVLELFKNTDFSGRENRLGLQSVASAEGGTTTTTIYKDLTTRFRSRLAPYITRAWL
jgi:hypothetical protein